MALDLPLDIFNPDGTEEMSRLRSRARISDLRGIQHSESRAEDQLVTEIAKTARVHLEPRLSFGHCIEFPIAGWIQPPGAWRLTVLIRARLSVRKEDPVRPVDTNLSPGLRVMFENLFAQENGANRYWLTLLGRISWCTLPGGIRNTAANMLSGGGF